MSVEIGCVLQNMKAITLVLYDCRRSFLFCGLREHKHICLLGEIADSVMKSTALLLSSLYSAACASDFFLSTRTRNPCRLGVSPSSPLLLRLRGGSDRSWGNLDNNRIVQLNPSYTGNNRPYTLGDLEQDYPEKPSSYHIDPRHQTVVFGRNHGRLSPLQLVYRHAQDLLRSSPPLFATTASCIVVFFMWQISYFRSVLQRNFVTSRFNMAKGRWPAVLFSAVSHTEILHLIFNLSSFLMLGPKVQRILESSNYSRWTMWSFLVGSALASSASFLMCERSGAMLGLSGVTTALLAIYARSFPDYVLRILVAGIVPVRMSAHQLLQITLLWSLVGTLVAMTGRPQRIAHSAHLGGLLFGLSYFELRRRRFWLARQRQRKARQTM